MAAARGNRINDAVSAVLAEVYNLIPRLVGGRTVQAADFIGKAPPASSARPKIKMNATQLAQFLGIPGA